VGFRGVPVPSRSVVVLGGDPAALLVAGRLALDGHEVVLWQAPALDRTVTARCDGPCIRVSGSGGDGQARLAAVTSDPFRALAAGDVLLTCLSPHDHRALVEQVLPLIEPRHTLVLLEGGLQGLVLAKWLGDRGRSDLPTMVAGDSAPFFGLGATPGRADVSAVVAAPGFGVFPACRTEAAIAVLKDLFPGARAHAHLVAAALAAVEPFLRAPALLMNRGGSEGRQPGSSPFADGFSAGVARVAEALDDERLALAAALGLDLPTAADALHAWGLSPRGDLWGAVNGSFALTHLSDTGASQADRLADSVAFGLRPWVELADALGVAWPVARSLVVLHRAVTGVGAGNGGWTLDDLGIAGMTAAALGGFLATGSDEPTA
jgi:opine dehydrogenase